MYVEWVHRGDPKRRSIERAIRGGTIDGRKKEREEERERGR